MHTSLNEITRRNHRDTVCYARFARGPLTPALSLTLPLPPRQSHFFSHTIFSRMKRALRAFAIMPRGRCEKPGEFLRRKGFH